MPRSISQHLLAQWSNLRRNSGLLPCHQSVLRASRGSSSRASRDPKEMTADHVVHAAKVLADHEAEALVIEIPVDRVQAEGRADVRVADLREAAIALDRDRAASVRLVQVEEEISNVRAAAVMIAAARAVVEHLASGQDQAREAAAVIARRDHVHHSEDTVIVRKAIAVDTRLAHRAEVADMIAAVEVVVSIAEVRVVEDMLHVRKAIAVDMHLARKAAEVTIVAVEAAASTAEAVVATTVVDKAAADTIVAAAVDMTAAARVVEATRVEAAGIARTSDLVSRVAIVPTHRDHKEIVHIPHVRKVIAKAVMHRAAAVIADRADHRGIVRSEVQ
jgi:hypothetical protein